MTNNRPLAAAPTTHQRRLSNGIQVYYLHTVNDPIAACHLLIPRGCASEPDEQLGITTLMWSLLAKGTQKRSARQLAEDIESIGAYLGAGATQDYSEISCHAVGDYFGDALEIMRECLLEPAFFPDEVAKEKVALMAAIQSKKENIFTVAYEEFSSVLFRRHPYGRPSTGNERTVGAITETDLAQWHGAVAVPDGAVLAIASNLPFDEIWPDLERLFGAERWKKSGHRAPQIGPPPRAEKPMRLERVEHFEQAYLLMGFPAPAVGSDDYLALKLVNGLLGGGMSARLFQSLREKKGLAYDVGSFYPTKKAGSTLVFYIGLQFSRLPEAKARMEAELDKICNKRVSDTELAQMRNYIKGSYILDHQTNSQRAHYLGWWKILGRDPDYDRTYIKEIDRVSPARLQRVAQTYLSQPPCVVEIHPRPKRAGGKPVDVIE